MGQLTWRDIALPQLSTNDLAVAGAGIGRAFDRLAGTLDARDTRLGQKATSDALAPILMADTAEQAKLLAAQAMANPNARIDRTQLAREYSSQINNLLEREQTQFTVDGQRAETQYGDKLPAYLKANYDGNKERVNAMIAEMASDPLGRRMLAAHAGEGFEAGTKGDTYRTVLSGQAEDARAHDLTHADNQASTAVARFNAQTNARESNFRMTEAQRLRNEAAATRQAEEAGRAVAQRVADRAGMGVFTGEKGADATRFVYLSPEYKAAKTDAERNAVVKGFGTIYDERVHPLTAPQALEQQREYAGKQPLLDQARVAQETMRDKATRNVPGLTAMTRLPDFVSAAKLTPTQLIDQLKGMNITPATVAKLQERGLTQQEIMAVASTADTHFSIWRGDGTANSNVLDAAEDFIKLRDNKHGVLGQQQALAAVQMPFEVAVSQISQLRSQAELDKRINGGKVTEKTALALAAAERQLQMLNDTALSGKKPGSASGGW